MAKPQVAALKCQKDRLQAIADAGLTSPQCAFRAESNRPPHSNMRTAPHPQSTDMRASVNTTGQAGPSQAIIVSGEYRVRVNKRQVIQ